jgi:hypothetical protein
LCCETQGRRCAVGSLQKRIAVTVTIPKSGWRNAARGGSSENGKKSLAIHAEVENTIISRAFSESTHSFFPRPCDHAIIYR